MKKSDKLITYRINGLRQSWIGTLTELLKTHPDAEIININKLKAKPVKQQYLFQKIKWYEIPGYNGIYQISPCGKVRNSKSGKTLRQSINTNGYNHVVLSSKGIQKTLRIHKLVAITFLNHKPNGYKKVVDHIDSDRANNSISNLQIISHRENLLKDKKPASGEHHISKKGKKWRIDFKIKQKTKYCGTHETIEEAVKVRDKILKKNKIEVRLNK